MRRPRERDKKDDLLDGGLKRSSSVKGRSETKGDVIARDPEEKKEQKADKQKGEITNGLVARKPVFGVFNKVRFKPACSATETS